MSTKAPTKRASFSLQDEYQDLFKQITDLTRRNMTDELRVMLDARAQTLGIKPIKPVDPKSFGSLLEKAQAGT